MKLIQSNDAPPRDTKRRGRKVSHRYRHEVLREGNGQMKAEERREKGCR